MNDDAIFLNPAEHSRSVGIKLKLGRLTLGRDPSCDIVLADVSISRRHAVLTLEGRVLHLCDLSSRNGTFLNRRRVRQATAVIGDKLAFAEMEFVLVDGADELLETDDPDPPNSGEAGYRTTVVDRLTAAQNRVFEKLLNGLSEKEIASALGISPNTVHRHVCRIYQLAGVNSRSELLAIFVVHPRSTLR